MAGKVEWLGEGGNQHETNTRQAHEARAHRRRPTRADTEYLNSAGWVVKLPQSFKSGGPKGAFLLTHAVWLCVCVCVWDICNLLPDSVGQKPPRLAPTAPSTAGRPCCLGRKTPCSATRLGPQWLIQAIGFSLLDTEGCGYEAWICGSHSATRGT